MTIYDKMPMKFIRYATERGIHLTLEKDCINLETQMKSELRLYWENGQYVVRGRYDYFNIVKDFYDLASSIRHCDHTGDGNYTGNLQDIYHNDFGDLDWTPFE